MDSQNTAAIEEIPGPEVMNRIEAQFPNRLVDRFVISEGGREHVFVLTSPLREEWKKMRAEISSANGDADKIELAVERAALAQIRWPEREKVQELFQFRPGIILEFADELRKLAGADGEVRSKKF